MGLLVCGRLLCNCTTTSDHITDYEPTKPIDLNGPLHTLFDRKRWEVEDDEYRLLLPSMHLASNLLEAGMPWISNFLPSDKLYDPVDETSPESYDPKYPEFIEDNQQLSERDILEARKELLEIAESVRWQINYEMYRQPQFDEQGAALQWMGITRLVDTDRPWGVTTYEEIQAADDATLDKELDRRPLIVGLMGEYVTALKYSPVGSEEHLRAAFMAGITITHEIGHVVFHQDFRALNSDLLKEPYFGADCTAELGFSFICSIFGWHPQIRIEGNPDFSLSLYWEPRYTMDLTERPLYKEIYAIPVQYTESLLLQEFWDSVGDPRRMTNIFEFQSLQKNLSPEVMTKEGAPVARMPNWSYSHTLREAEWKDSNFRLEGYRKGDEIVGLTQEELDYGKERTQTDGDGPHEILSDEQIAFRKKIAKLVLHGPGGGEDDTEEFGEDLEDFLDPEVRGIPQFDVDDGILEDDVDPALECKTTPLTWIEVTYLAETSTSANPYKRVRFNDGGTLNRYKKAKLGKSDLQTFVAEFLSQVNPYQISKWTRIEAHHFCVANGLRTYPAIPEEVYWQSSRLELTEHEDMAIVQRICEFKFGEAALEISNNDPNFDQSAVRPMWETTLKYIPHWADVDLKEFCGEHKLQGETRDQMVQAIRQKRRALIQAMRGNSNTQQPHGAALKTIKPGDRTYSSLVELCRKHDLPTWGTKNALIERALRLQEEEERIVEGESREFVNIRPDQPHRTDANGFELYVFRAILGRSSVTALKSALFIAGNFRPDAELTLFFYPDSTDTLEDGKPLSSYKYKNWTTLRLKVSTKWRFGPDSSKAAPIDFTGVGTKLRSGTQISALPAPASPQDPAAEREKELAEGASMTVKEKFDSITARIPALNRLVMYKAESGKWETRSAREILGNVEDLEDEEEMREEEHKPLSERKKQPAKRKLRNPLSHMADIFDRINRPRGPVEYRETNI
jgi:hypothetical protein